MAAFYKKIRFSHENTVNELQHIFAERFWFLEKAFPSSKTTTTTVGNILTFTLTQKFIVTITVVLSEKETGLEINSNKIETGELFHKALTLGCTMNLKSAKLIK